MQASEQARGTLSQFPSEDNNYVASYNKLSTNHTDIWQHNHYAGTQNQTGQAPRQAAHNSGIVLDHTKPRSDATSFIHDGSAVSA